MITDKNLALGAARTQRWVSFAQRRSAHFLPRMPTAGRLTHLGQQFLHAGVNSKPPLYSACQVKLIEVNLRGAGGGARQAGAALSTTDCTDFTDSRKEIRIIRAIRARIPPGAAKPAPVPYAFGAAHCTAFTKIRRTSGR